MSITARPFRLRRLKHASSSLLIAAFLTPAGLGTTAHAADGAWWSGIKAYGHLDAGITYNPDNPDPGVNFGHLFTDKPNQPLVNQLLLTLERPLDPLGNDYQLGFKLQGMFGSDARYTHFLNEFDRVISERHQVDVVEAYVNARLPILTSGGLDLKVGQFVTALGAEVIDARGNYLYSHSYIFNFGIPFKHTGVMAGLHVLPTTVLFAGVNTGVNTSIGHKGDNNNGLSYHAGIGWEYGKVAVNAFTHIGPENPRGNPRVDSNEDLRYLNDVTITYNPTKTLKLITDINYIRDDGFSAQGFGAAQYVVYGLNDNLALVGRVEGWRDSDGFFVAAFPGNRDFVNSERGLPATVINARPTTYGAVTVGLNYKPDVPRQIEGFVVRPEVRYDRSLNGTRPFDRSIDQFTASVDAILPF